jgi:hypothetical protein
MIYPKERGAEGDGDKGRKENKNCHRLGFMELDEDSFTELEAIAQFSDFLLRAVG